MLGLLWAGAPFIVSGQNQTLLSSDSSEAVVPVPVAASAAVHTASAAAVLRGESEQARLYWLRRKAFVESIVEQTAHDLSDSTMIMRFAITAGALALSPEELSKIPPATDPIGARLQQENLGVPGLLNVGNLIGAGLKYLTGRTSAGEHAPELWTAIPTETEARVMDALWAKRAATDSEIYARLDSVALTFKDMQAVLDNMLARGLVEREQISPKNELTILGTFTVEMSRKNARNREYLYRPRTSRRMFYTFLDALAFSRYSSLKSEDVALRDHLSRLLTLVAPRDRED